MTVLHCAGVAHDLAPGEDADRLADQIELKLRERGGWVRLETTAGRVALLVSAGVPIWLDHSERPQTGFGVAP